MKDFHLYVILDKKSLKARRSFFEVARSAIEGGADCIQLRDKELSTLELIKEGKKLRDLTRRSGTIFIVNDRADIALAVDADGVHLGQEDLPIAIARQILGTTKIIGRSTHSLPQAIEAEQQGADYIGVGPIFATPTKPTYPAVGLDLIRQVSEHIRIPFVAIGGIDAGNIESVLEAGAKRVAVVRAVVGADDVQGAAKRMSVELTVNRIL